LTQSRTETTPATATPTTTTSSSVIVSPENFDSVLSHSNSNPNAPVFIWLYLTEDVQHALRSGFLLRV
jgi:hypothetical protein